MAKYQLAALNYPGINTGRIYRMGLSELRQELDAIISRGWIGYVVESQRELCYVGRKTYEQNTLPSAGKLLDYTITNTSSKGLVINGDVELSVESAHFQDRYKDVCGFSIHALGALTLDEAKPIFNIKEINGFEMTILRSIL